MTDDERAALSGARHIVRVLYSVLRDLMDWNTGVVGKTYKISIAGLATELRVDPKPGVAEESFSTRHVDRALDELVRRGLIRRDAYNNQKNKQLILQLPLTIVDNSETPNCVKNKVVGGWWEVGGSKVVDENAIQNSELSDEIKESGGRLVGSENQKVVPYQYISISSVEKNARAHEEQKPEEPKKQEEPKSALGWAQFFIQLRQFPIRYVQTPKTIAQFASWVAQGVTTQDVLLAVAAAEAQLGGIPDTPNYYFPFVKNLLLQRQRLLDETRATKRPVGVATTRPAPHIKHCADSLPASEFAGNNYLRGASTDEELEKLFGE